MSLNVWWPFWGAVFLRSIINEKTYVCDGYTVTFKLETEWNTGYNTGIVIQNTGNEVITDWYMYFKYDGEITNLLEVDR